MYVYVPEHRHTFFKQRERELSDTKPRTSVSSLEDIYIPRLCSVCLEVLDLLPDFVQDS